MSEPAMAEKPRHAYNAIVVSLRRVHDELCILRVRTDGPRPQFVPGQYIVLGLGSWEPRCDGVPAFDGPDVLIRRAYSISNSLTGPEGRLLRCGDYDYLEFYVALVRKTEDRPPSLTPRLFALEEGSRLFVGRRAHGTYTLDPVGPDQDVIFAATGTGEAPHNAMIPELLAANPQRRVLALTCVRRLHDLAYLEEHRRLEQAFLNYRYVPLTTREPQNLDPQRDDYVGKLYLQDLLAGDKLQRHTGWRLDPAREHVFLCGNPSMIGLPRRDASRQMIFPEPPGVVEVLVRRGFVLDEPRVAGNIHYEKYW